MRWRIACLIVTSLRTFSMVKSLKTTGRYKFNSVAKKAKIKVKNPKKEDMVSEIDFSEGFGGIPESVSLTKNIGCASDSVSKRGKILKKD